MRTLTVLVCLVAASALVAGAARATPPSSGVGTLSVQGGKGTVTLGLRGSVLGRLADGVLTVTDLTPRDRYGAIVTGSKLTQRRLGPFRVRYRGVGLRYRMLGGGYRISLRGEGIDLSAVGRGSIVLDGDRKLPTDDAGVYSLTGVDCGVDTASCTPLPDTPQRFTLGPMPGPPAHP